jgi:hypothetical protein
VPEHEPQQFDACDVCGRTILRGERIFEYVTPDRERRGVCALCRERAEADGWVQADSEGALTYAAAPPRRRGLRGARLRERVARAGERVRSATARTLPDARSEPGHERFEPPSPDSFEPPRRGEPFDPSRPTRRERPESRPAPVADPGRAPLPAPDPAPDPPPVPVPALEPEPDGAGEPDLDAGEAEDIAPPQDEPALAPDPAIEAEPPPEPELPVEPEPPLEPEPPAPPPEPDTPERRMGRAVVRFNQGDHPRIVAGLMRSLGEPRAAVHDLSAEPPRAQVSIAWELSWYQWEVSVDSEEEAVREVAKGGDVSEFDSEPDWNATVGSDGELHWPSASS